MNRLDQLLSEYFDGCLSESDRAELSGLLDRDPSARSLFVELYREHRALAAVHRLTSDEAFSRSVVAELESDRHRFITGVMRQLDVEAETRAKPRLVPVFAPSPPQDDARHKFARPSRWPFSTRNWLPLAAVLTLLGALIWWVWLRPLPVRAHVAEATIGAIVQRGQRTQPAEPGVALQAKDMLLTRSNQVVTVRFDHESTSLRLAPNSEIRLEQRRAGKWITIRRGSLEAQVAPQPAGRPLRLQTPQATATVVGTRLTITARHASTWLEVSEGRVLLARAQDRSEVAVSTGQFAVAARGIELIARPAPVEGGVSAVLLPVPIFYFTEYTHQEGWFTSTNRIEQRDPNGLLYHPYQLPPVEGSVLIEVLARLDDWASPPVMTREGWGFGLGLRFAGEERMIYLRSFQRDTGPGVLEFSDLAGFELGSVPGPTVRSGVYQLKLWLDRSSDRHETLRGKVWRQFEAEPEDWTLVSQRERRGPLAAVGVTTLNCAVTFVNLNVLLVE